MIGSIILYFLILILSYKVVQWWIFVPFPLEKLPKDIIVEILRRAKPKYHNGLIRSSKKINYLMLNYVRQPWNKTDNPNGLEWACEYGYLNYYITWKNIAKTR